MLRDILSLVVLCTCISQGFAVHVNDLTLEEKVGQILMAHMRGEVVNEEAHKLVKKAHVGGIIYYNWANGLHSPKQVKELSAGLQLLAKETNASLPLLIGIDQEGGLVSRLTNGFTKFPGNKALGMSQQPCWAEDSAYIMGMEMRSVGINMNFAPVLDINSNPQNPIIGLRSFGETPEIVTIFGAATLEGFRRAKLITSIKHFPGHGDVDMDSHENMPVIDKQLASLESNELIPFRTLNSIADTVMTAHILVFAFDEHHCVTLSKRALDYLQNYMRFDGVIVSDSLVMKGVLHDGISVDEVCVQAFNAGCDILLLGGKALVGPAESLELNGDDVIRIHQYLVQAVKSGRISEARLNKSVEKILALKDYYPIDKTVEFDLDSPKSQALSKAIATKALIDCIKTNDERSSTLHLEKLYQNLDQKKVLVIAPKMLDDAMHQTSIFHLGNENRSFIYKELNPSDAEVSKVKSLIDKSDVVIFCAYNAWRNPGQEAMIEELVKSGKTMVLLILGDPLDAEAFPLVTRTITTFSPTAPSIQAACEKLLKAAS